MPLFITAVLAAVILILLVLAGSSIWLAQRDAAWLATQLNQRVLADKQHTLHIDGPVSVRVFPTLQLEAQQLRLSATGSAADFIQLRKLALSLQWWPLLSRRVAVDRLVLDGLSVHVERDAQGRYNFADLWPTSSAAANPWTVDIASLHLQQGRLALHLQAPQDEQIITLSNIELRTGRLTNASAQTAQGQLNLAAGLRVQTMPTDQARDNASNPDVDAQLQLSTTYQLALAADRHELSDLQLQWRGQLAAAGLQDTNLKLRLGNLLWQGGSAANESNESNVSKESNKQNLQLQQLQVDASAAHSAVALPAPLKLSLTLPQLHWQAQQLQTEQFHLQLQTDASEIKVTNAADAAPHKQLAATLTSALTADLTKGKLQLSALHSALSLELAQSLAKPLQLQLQGELALDLPGQQVTSQLTGNLHETQLSAWLQTRGSQLTSPDGVQVDFGLKLDQLNLDDYLLPNPANAQDNTLPELPTLPQGLALQGELSLDSLQMAGTQLRNLRLAINTKNGQLQWQGAAR